MTKIYKENNSFCTRIYIGTNANGKPKYKKLKAKTKKELQHKAMEFLKAIGRGEDVGNTNYTLSNWIERYLKMMEDEVLCDNIKESEYKTLKARLEFFIYYSNGILGNAKLKDILPSHIQPAINQLYRENPNTGKKSAKKTIQRYIRALSNIFEFARRERAYSFCNPCSEVTTPKNAVSNTRTSVSKRTIELILKTEHRAKLPACIMLLAGLRRGEVAALTWNDIDLKNRIINVNKSYDYKQSELKDTKTKAGMRKIPINNFLFNLLLEERKKAKGKLVVEKASGGRMTEAAWKRLFQNYMEALSAADKEDGFIAIYDDECFEEFTAHQLRHTYCSMLHWSGVDIKTAQELMGHSEYETTANIYTHVDDNSKANAAKLQDEYIDKICNSSYVY